MTCTCFHHTCLVLVSSADLGYDRGRDPPSLVLLQGTAMTLFVRKIMRFRVIFIPFPLAKNRFDYQIACMLIWVVRVWLCELQVSTSLRRWSLRSRICRSWGFWIGVPTLLQLTCVMCPAQLQAHAAWCLWYANCRSRPHHWATVDSLAEQSAACRNTEDNWSDCQTVLALGSWLATRSTC